MLRALLACLVFPVLAWLSASGQSTEPRQATLRAALPGVTSAGLLQLGASSGASLFYAFYDSERHASSEADRTPVVLWLQGGPGCSGMLGNFFEMGPYLVDHGLALRPNPAAWNMEFGLLFIDQPIGTGLSPRGTRDIPADELAIAHDLYAGLQAFYSGHPELKPRPLFITGQSYAGKYVPAIGHFILQAEAAAAGKPLSAQRPFPEHSRQLGAPLFQLAGLAMGNGLTDPVSQVEHAADGAYYMGLIDSQQRARALSRQQQVVQLTRSGQWHEANRQRTALLTFLRMAAGGGTMSDARRLVKYDHTDSVGRYMNQPAVLAALGVQVPPEGPTFVTCSKEVLEALGPDKMRSVADLIPHILQHLPLLLYQGLFDVQDGPATQEGWLSELQWPGQAAWAKAHRYLWRPRLHTPPNSARLELELQLPSQQVHGPESTPAEVAGYWKQVGALTQVVLRDAGHMPPHDAPLQAQAMLERWVYSVLSNVSQSHTSL